MAIGDDELGSRVREGRDGDYHANRRQPYIFVKAVLTYNKTLLSEVKGCGKFRIALAPATRGCSTGFFPQLSPLQLLLGLYIPLHWPSTAKRLIYSQH
jgi:hypothetical protein